MLQEFTQVQVNTAMKSADHLKRWLAESGRSWLVLKADDLVDSLPWPEGVDLLIGMVEGYRKHRMGTMSGRTEKVKHPVTQRVTEIPIPKTDALEVEELDRCIRFLIGQVTSLDESWSLDNPPL
jgi:hypothetical protein